VLAGQQTKPAALAAYGAFSAAHRWKFEWMLRVQDWIPKVPPRLLGPTVKTLESRAFARWMFNHYLEIAPPEYVRSVGGVGRSGGPARLAAATSR
jgi:hypothetical protein